MEGEILERLEAIDAKITDVVKRVDGLEIKSESSEKFTPRFGQFQPEESVSDIRVLQNGATRGQEASMSTKIERHREVRTEPVGPTVHRLSATDDIQGEFNVIKDSVVKVKLSPDLKLTDTTRGVKRADQPFANVIQKCGRYAETTLKLLLTIDEAEVSNDTLLDLWHVQLAQIRYLQEEFSSLLVQGQFNPDVARLYRTLQKNTSGFTPNSLDILEKATTISAANIRAQPATGRGRGAGFSRGSFGRGRARYSGFNRDNYLRDIPNRSSDYQGSQGFQS